MKNRVLLHKLFLLLFLLVGYWPVSSAVSGMTPTASATTIAGISAGKQEKLGFFKKIKLIKAVKKVYCSMQMADSTYRAPFFLLLLLGLVALGFLLFYAGFAGVGSTLSVGLLVVLLLAIGIFALVVLLQARKKNSTG